MSNISREIFDNRPYKTTSGEIWPLNNQVPINMYTNATEFEEFELENSLFNIQIDGVPIWERIRLRVFRQIERQSGAGKAHTGIGDDWKDYIQGSLLLLKNVVRKNPFFSDSSDIIYIGHERRKKQNDGYWWDIYCDPIHQACDHEYIHFETPHQLEHLRPARTTNLRYLDLIEHSGTIQRILGVNKPEIPKHERVRLEDIQLKIRDLFDADIDLVSMTRSALHMRRTDLWLYRRLLNRVDPELVVLVVSYVRETFIEACKELDIPVVELQHGVIHEHHFGYSYPGPRTKETFPDYILTFGDFWTETVEFPIPDDRVISVGYPYLEQSVNKYNDIETKDHLLFISQGTIGEQLSKFAMEVDQQTEIDHEIVYKLHPGEFDRWEDEYPWLLDADFEIIGDSDRQLYELFAESSGQVGVGSTAIYEGLAFGLNTYVYDCLGSSILKPLVDDGAAHFISSVEDLIPLLEGCDTTFDQGYYFLPNATEQTCSIIEHLIDHSDTYGN